MHNLNKTVLSLSIYTAFLAYALSNDWLYIPAGCMFVASILSEIGGRLLDNRKLPIRPLVEIEEKKAEVEEFAVGNAPDGAKGLSKQESSRRRADSQWLAVGPAPPQAAEARVRPRRWPASWI